MFIVSKRRNTDHIAFSMKHIAMIHPTILFLGARVIIACRDITKAERAAESIKCSTGHSVNVKRLDLASLDSVRKFAENILKTEKNIDILINNAGYYLAEIQGGGNYDIGQTVNSIQYSNTLVCKNTFMRKRQMYL